MKKYHPRQLAIFASSFIPTAPPIIMEMRMKKSKIFQKSVSLYDRICQKVVERLSEENEKLKIEIQKLRDENNRLKGEQGKPKIPGKKGSGKGKNVSSEKERKQREGKEEKPKSKKKNIPINRTEICKVDPSILPADAEYRKEIFNSPSEKRTYVGELPTGIVGEFGPGIRSLVCTLKYVANMSQPKIRELLENCGIDISQSTISRILTNDETGFNQEKKDIFRAALEHTPYHPGWPLQNPPLVATSKSPTCGHFKIPHL